MPITAPMTKFFNRFPHVRITRPAVAPTLFLLCEPQERVPACPGHIHRLIYIHYQFCRLRGIRWHVPISNES